MDRNSDLKNSKHQEYHHGHLRKALVNAALNLLKEEGIQSLSLRRVARRVGVSPTAPYSHFKDKTSLLAAVATEGYLAMSKFMELETIGAITEKERLLGLAKGYVNFAIEEKSLFQLMFSIEIGSFDQFPDLEKAARYCQDLFLYDSSEDYYDNEIQQTTQAIGVLAIWSLVHGLATLLIDGKADPKSFGGKDHESLVEAVASLLILAETGDSC